MKKLLLTLFCLFAMFAVKAQCDYTLTMSDSYGDGWQGQSITFSVAGVETSYSLSGGFSGTETIPSYLNDLVIITLVGIDQYGEISFTISDPTGTVVASGGPSAPAGELYNSITPSTCVFEIGCDYTLEMDDSYGDGWQGQSITFSVAGVETTYALASGFSGTETISSFTDDPVIITLNGADTYGEISFSITDPTATVVASGGPSASAGELYNSLSPSSCAPPNCLLPNTLAISNVVADGAQVSFVSGNTTPSGNYEYELVNTTNGEVADGTPDGTATTTTIMLSGLTQNDNYEIYVREVCGASEESSYASTSWTQTELPGCATNLSPAEGDTNSTGSAVVFTWDAPTTGGTATSYDFYYGLNGAVADNLLGNFTDQTATVYGFPAGNHNYSVVAKNAGGDAVSCTSINFNIDLTPQAPPGITCDAGDVSTSQFTESFDAQGSWTGDFGGAGGWQFDTNSTGSGGTGPTGPQDTGGSYMFYEATSATGSASAVSPVIDLSAIAAGNEAELSFYMHAYGSNMGILSVGASTSATGPFTNIFTWGGQLQTTTNGAWYQVGADVSAYTGGDLYIQFTMATRGSYLSDMSVDTMEVVACDIAPTCLIPTTLTATISSGGSTTIDWVDPNDPAEDDFDYELLDVTAGETATGVPTGQVTTNSLDLTSLVEDNDYQLLVRTACSRGGLSGESYSDWSTALSWTQTELPGCVTNLSPADGDIVNGGSVVLTWDLATTGGTPTGHKVLWSAVDEASMTSLGTLGATTTSVAITNVAAAGTYYYSIVPTNGTGDATGCSVQTFTTYPEDVGGSSCATAVAVTEGTYSTSIPIADDAAWFVFTAATSGSLNVSSCGGGKDTTLYIYEVCGGSTYASGTDNCSMSPSGGGSSYAAEATFDVTAGQTYYIAWDDAWSSDLFQWSITLTSPCSGPVTTWDGTSWSNGAPDANSYAVMSGAYSTGTDGAVTACVMQVDADVTIDGSIDAAISEVLVMAGNILTIDETSSLTVSGDFTNTGTVTLNSTADDFSSLIVTGTATGDITYNRYVNVYDDTLGGGWDLVCSPVDMTIADFITANGANIQVLGDDYAFSQFNNATGQWERYATASQTGSFITGQGYSMATTAGATVAYTGTMETTSQSINIINNNGLNGVGRRWNLVSNPFPSYINGNTAAGASNFMDANAAVIDSEFLAVYGWNGSEYTIYNQLSGAFSMAPGQGFWVAALGTTDTALDFTAAMRTTTGTGDFVQGPQLLTYNVGLKLYNGDIERAATEFYFRDGLSLGLDPGYDAAAFNQSTKLSSRLTLGSQETAFEINAMSIDALQNTRVPLEVRQNAGQAFTISMADMNLPEDIYVYLEDTVNGTLTSLKENDFELVAQSNLSGSDRFFIVFKSNSVLSSGDTLGINALNVFKANNDDFVTIAGITPDLGQLDVRLYSMLGQTVRQDKLNTTTATQRISTAGLASGLYMVQIKSGNQTTVKKVIVK